MTLRQTIQAAPIKTNELIAKLANTSNQALKTRESLLGELTDELSSFVELEDRHFLPVLRKHNETKDLALVAFKGIKELRAQLGELEATPKDSDAFLEKLTELQTGFQTHVRDGRNELLPAALKVLSEEEAAELASNMESALADAERAQHEAKREEIAQAKREAQAAEEAEAAKRSAVRAEKAAERATHEALGRAADALKTGAVSVKDGTRAVAAGVAHRTEQATSSLREAVATYRGASQDAVADLKAISASSSKMVTVASEAGSAWVSFAKKIIGLNLDTSRRIINCRSIGQLAEVQRDYVKGSMRTWIEAPTEFLEIAQRASKQALHPLQSRLRETS